MSGPNLPSYVECLSLYLALVCLLSIAGKPIFGSQVSVDQIDARPANLISLVIAADGLYKRDVFRKTSAPFYELEKARG